MSSNPKSSTSTCWKKSWHSKECRKFLDLRCAVAASALEHEVSPSGRGGGHEVRARIWPDIFGKIFWDWTWKYHSVSVFKKICFRDFNMSTNTLMKQQRCALQAHLQDLMLTSLTIQHAKFCCLCRVSWGFNLNASSWVLQWSLAYCFIISVPLVTIAGVFECCYSHLHHLHDHQGGLQCLAKSRRIFSLLMSETGMNIYTYTDSMPLNIYVPVYIYIYTLYVYMNLLVLV